MGSAESTEQRAPGRAAAWIVASAIVLLVGAWITIPGIDTEVLAAAQGSLVGMFDSSAWLFPIVGQSIGALIAVRLALDLIGKTASGPARVIALAIYLALAAIQAFALAVWAESTSYELVYGDLVAEPGWRFRLVATLTSVTGAAVLWWLADRIDATRAATGALAFALLASVMGAAQEATAFSSALAVGAVTPMAGLLVLVLPASMLALAIALAARTPPAWPVKVVRSLEVRSSFDVLAGPGVLAVLSSSALGTVGVPHLVRAALVIAATIGLVVLLRVRVPAPAERRALWPLALALGSLAFVAVPMTLGLVSSGALSRALEPGPLEGEASFQITLGATDRFREGEAQAMVDLLNALGASAELVSADAQRITIRVESARDPGSVTDALRPHTLALHLVDEPPSEELPAGVRPPSSYARAAEGPCPILEQWAPSLGCTAAIDRIQAEHDEYDSSAAPAEPSECRVYCLEPAPVITAEHIASAQVVSDPYDSRPIVSATLTDAAAERFGRVTRENIDRQLAIVLDGEIVSAPVIRGAIEDGRVQITMGGFRSYDETLAEANALVSTLRAGGAITSEWTLESVE